LTTSVLELSHIGRRFGHVIALKDASFRLRPGSIHALLGENGAGKTTLMRIAYGLLQPDAGRIHIDGSEVSFRSPADAIEHGIAMVHQHFSSIDQLTVAENVALGDRGRLDLNRIRKRIRQLSERTGFDVDPDMPAGALSVGGRQRLEVLKALAREARVLILDEPTAVLAPPEVDSFLAVLRQFAATGGSVTIITHKLREVLAAADYVTVLRLGVTVGTLDIREANELELTRLMFGDAFEQGPERLLQPQHASRPSPDTATSGPAATEPVLQAHDIWIDDERGATRVRGVSLSVRAGEIVGLAGVDGSGHRELMRALAGLHTPSSGTIQRPHRVGFVPEDRQQEALVLPFTIRENVALRSAGTARGRVDWSRWEKEAHLVVDRFDVRPSDVSAPADELSGGNQQKLVLGRELTAAPGALVIENPTRGLDANATLAVHRSIRDARERGAAVLLYTSDLDELVDLSDRILVMFAGTATPAASDPGAIGRVMLGLL
jgi:simple sugar transport system ATP-binding protein